MNHMVHGILAMAWLVIGLGYFCAWPGLALVGFGLVCTWLQLASVWLGAGLAWLWEIGLSLGPLIISFGCALAKH